MSYSVLPHELQHARLPCPSLSLWVCSDSCPLSQWCHPIISSPVTLLLLPTIFAGIRVFFQWIVSLHQMAKVLELQHQSFQWMFRVDFPVVMYGCESWTIKKAKHWRINAFELWCWRRLLRVPGTAKRPNQSIIKEVKPEYSLEGLIWS